MKKSVTRLTAATALSLGLLASVSQPALAQGIAPAQAPGFAAHAEDACKLSDATITWGLKESFRAYISGSIANGSWEVADGAEYKTPNFIFPKGVGAIDPHSGVANVKSLGSVHFTGHDGVLDITLANPSVQLVTDSQGLLLADMRATDTSGAVVVDEQQVELATLDLANHIKVSDSEIAVDGAPAALTTKGAESFGGFYSEGEQLDPLNMTAAADGCAAMLFEGAEEHHEDGEAHEDSGEHAAAGSETAATDSGAGQNGADVPWLPIGIGAAAILVIGVTGGMLLSGKKSKPQTAAATPEAAAAPETTGTTTETKQ